MDVKQHLLERGLNPSLYNCSWDEETAAFILFNLSGQLAGYQQYRPFAPKSFPNNPKLGRYYTYAKDKIAVWGMETYNWNSSLLFVAEGIFDACKLHNQGMSAIAVLSNDPQKLRGWLFALPRTIVTICDNDKAGKKLAKMGQMSYNTPSGKDLGDMSDSEVEAFLSTSMGIIK